MVDKEVSELVDMLHLDEKDILERFHFTLKGKQLTESEAVRFIRFLRNELQKTQLKH